MYPPAVNRNVDCRRLWSAVARYRCTCDSELCSERLKTQRNKYFPSNNLQRIPAFKADLANPSHIATIDSCNGATDDV